LGSYQPIDTLKFTEQHISGPKASKHTHSKNLRPAKLEPISPTAISFQTYPHSIGNSDIIDSCHPLQALQALTTYYLLLTTYYLLLMDY